MFKLFAIIETRNREAPLLAGVLQDCFPNSLITSRKCAMFYVKKLYLVKNKTCYALYPAK